MLKSQIEEHPAWKYISSLSPKDRYGALLGSSKSVIANNFGVRIEEWAYGNLGSVKNEYLAIAVMDSFSNSFKLAVLIPNEIKETATI